MSDVTATELLFRNGTCDKDIFDAVARRNEYMIGDVKNMAVLDIGCHIGSFSYLVMQMGARHVVGVEPCLESAELARHNVGTLGPDYAARFTVLTGAGVGRSQVLYFPGLNPKEPNTGGTACNTKGPGQPVDCFTIGELVAHFGPFEVMKLDCEGGEWDILTHGDLTGISCIVGEFHTYVLRPPSELPAHEHLIELLKAQGFKDISVAGNPHAPALLGYFRAGR